METSRKKNTQPDNEVGGEGLPVVRPKVAGIDLGSKVHWVCAPKKDGAGRDVEQFGATTPELERMAAWLKERKVESVAMESTGVYWIPPHEVLERHGLEVVLVETRQLGRVPGRRIRSPAVVPSVKRPFTVTVEIFHGGKRVASHARNSIAYRHTTVGGHMPKSHQAHLEWTPSRLIHWAEGIGAATAQVVRTILERKPHPEMGYRACLGILRLEKIYSRARLEAASQRAVQLQTFSYQSLKSILKNSLDRQLLLEPEAAHPGPEHENVRGPHYYDPPTTLVQ